MYTTSYHSIVQCSCTEPVITVQCSCTKPVVSHLAQSPETGLTEDVAAGVHLEGFVEDVKTHGTDEILVDLGELRLGLQQLLTNHKSVL